MEQDHRGSVQAPAAGRDRAAEAGDGGSDAVPGRARAPEAAVAAHAAAAKGGAVGPRTTNRYRSERRNSDRR